MTTGRQRLVQAAADRAAGRSVLRRALDARGREDLPGQRALLSKLRGPLAVEGGPTGADRSLTNGVKLPGEKDDFLIAIGAQPPESQQIDVLNIFNDSSKANTSGTLDETTIRGFGMAETWTSAVRHRQRCSAKGRHLRRVAPLPGRHQLRQGQLRLGRLRHRQPGARSRSST
jgi:hypothetical protein